MARVLHRIGHGIAGHPLPVLLGWVAAVVAVLVLVSAVGADTSNDQSLPGTDSEAAKDVLAERFPPQQNGRSPLVFHVGDGTLEDGGTRQKAINGAATQIRKLDDVDSAINPFSTQGQAQLSEDGRTAFIGVLLTVGSDTLTTAQAQEVLDAAQPFADRAGLELAAGGPIGAELSKPETESSEVVGIVVAMVILTLAFGSVVAMGMPIVTAVLGLAAALGLIGLMGHVIGVPVIAPTLATMIGLGVGIDYALFLVTRHRDGLRAGMGVRESIAVAVATSGSAIVFAGTTVVIALLALAVAGIPLVTSLGYASAVAVVTAVLAAVTLLPALLALAGTRVGALRVPRFLRPAERVPGTGMWASWGRTVTRRPLVAIGAFVAVLAVLIVPLRSLELGQEDIGATPPGSQERDAYDLIAAGFGVGFNGPLLIGISLGTPATADPAVTAQEDELRSLQAELEQEQAEGQAQQAALQAQAAALEEQQAGLEAQQADLVAERSALEAQAAALARERDGLRAQRAVIEREVAAAGAAGRALVTRAEAAAARARAGAARRRAAERQLVAVAARVAAVREEIAAAGEDARPPLEALLTRLEAEAQRLRSRISAARADERAQRAEAAALRRQAASLPEAPGTLRRQLRTLVAGTEALARQAAALDRERARLVAEAAALERQASALKTEAADLQAQKADLEALQARAEDQQARALSLKDELTATLTKAGGDDRGTDPRLVRIQDALTGTAGIARTSPPQINGDGDAAVFTAIPTTPPAATETADLVVTLRTSVLPAATAGADLEAHVGGSTAANVDLADEITERLPVVILVVLALSVLVLLVAFRSFLVPVQAALVNLLCVAAAFGVLTAVFQFGWGIDPLGIDTARDTVPIASYVPLMMFAVLFGLSMDYQVFLLSSVATHRAGGEGDRQAVASGVASSARVITAAALIMIGVFGSFVLNGDPTVKQFGVGLALAVALAASAALILTPALLALMGRRTWWLPRAVERVVPHIDIEGESILAAHAHPEPEPEPEPEAVAEPEPEPAAPAPAPSPPAAIDPGPPDEGAPQPA
ncbi:MMPL family transporter [Miltoncostaea oceani]|uniref:MMPL family transporter n=1 Tax=Miltoncostaea oceani TaxID=2843216 RepID=UPI001C3CE111|nr:MMPL family transporter [Miltoncostaea oceani]